MRATIKDFLANVPRTTEQVAGLLGCSPEEAAAALWAFGLTRDPDSGLWRPGEDEEAKMLSGNVDLIIYAFSTAELARRFEERAEALLETGTTPLSSGPVIQATRSTIFPANKAIGRSTGRPFPFDRPLSPRPATSGRQCGCGRPRSAAAVAAAPSKRGPYPAKVRSTFAG